VIRRIEMKIKCEVIEDLLPLYIDEGCSRESKKLIKEHLDSCDSCVSTYESMSGDISVDKTMMTGNLNTKIVVNKTILYERIIGMTILGIILMIAATLFIALSGKWSELTLIIPLLASMIFGLSFSLIAHRIKRKQFNFSKALIGAVSGIIIGAAYVIIGQSTGSWLMASLVFLIFIPIGIYIFKTYK